MVRISVSYNSSYAYVYLTIVSDKSPELLVEHKESSIKSWAVVSFLLHGRRVRVIDQHIKVDEDSLDTKFLELAKKIDAGYVGLWSKVYDMVHDGEPREKIIKLLENFKPEPRRKTWKERVLEKMFIDSRYRDIPGRLWSFWRKIYTMIENGEPRENIIRELELMYIASSVK